MPLWGSSSETFYVAALPPPLGTIETQRPTRHPRSPRPGPGADRPGPRIPVAWVDGLEHPDASQTQPIKTLPSFGKSSLPIGGTVRAPHRGFSAWALRFFRWHIQRENYITRSIYSSRGTKPHQNLICKRDQTHLCLPRMHGRAPTDTDHHAPKPRRAPRHNSTERPVSPNSESCRRPVIVAPELGLCF